MRFQKIFLFPKMLYFFLNFGFEGVGRGGVGGGSKSQENVLGSLGFRLIDLTMDNASVHEAPDAACGVVVWTLWKVSIDGYDTNFSLV